MLGFLNLSSAKNFWRNFHKLVFDRENLSVLTVEKDMSLLLGKEESGCMLSIDLEKNVG